MWPAPGAERCNTPVSCAGAIRRVCAWTAHQEPTRPNATQCETCPACPAGTYDPCCSWDVTGDWFCTAHPGDADCVDLCQEQVFELACKNCPAGTYKNTSGSMACTPCSTCPAMQVLEPLCGGSEAGECVDCDPGKFSRIGDITCQTCPDCGPGTYDPWFWDTAEDTWHCLANPSSPACLDTCQGSVVPTSCVACPPGKYKTTSGSANCAACPVCEAMQVLEPPCAGSGARCMRRVLARQLQLSLGMQHARRARPAPWKNMTRAALGCG